MTDLRGTVVRLSAVALVGLIALGPMSPPIPRGAGEGRDGH